MNALVVYAHPLEDSFAAALRDAACRGLEAAGYAVDVVDLYADGFDPNLSAVERSAYMGEGYPVPEDVAGYCRRLREADILVLVFPQWWFGMPAILKGFVDRVFVPGVAFELDRAGGRLIPLLDRLKGFYVVTTTGSPWWVTELVMRNPVRRQLSIGIRRFCSRRARFRMLSLYDLDRASREKCAAFVARVERDLSAP